MRRIGGRLLAVVVVGLWLGFGLSSSAHAEVLHVYFGTYTDRDSQGIYRSEFDSETGTLSAPVLAAKADNPSFLAVHPTAPRIYAVSEVGDFGGQSSGAVMAFSMDRATGALAPLNAQPTGGAAPCHCIVDPTGGNVLVANYTGGSAAVFPLNAEGELQPASAFVQHQGSSVNAQRQEAAHAHSINVDPGNHFAVVADLGLDQVLVYRFDADRGTLQANNPPSTSVDPGSGPRHFAFHPGGRFAYVINELTLTVTAFKYAPQHGVLFGFQTIGTLPDDQHAPGQSTADVQVHPSGKFLYGSNRGHDSISVFSIDAESGALERVQVAPIGGRTPRNFGIDPSGRWLLAAGQDSDSVHVFQISAINGVLTPSGSPVSVPRPVCVKFVSKAE